jgi:hypothetical protein
VRQWIGSETAVVNGDTRGLALALADFMVRCREGPLELATAMAAIRGPPFGRDRPSEISGEIQERPLPTARGFSQSGKTFAQTAPVGESRFGGYSAYENWVRNESYVCV